MVNLIWITYQKHQSLCIGFIRWRTPKKL